MQNTENDRNRASCPQWRPLVYKHVCAKFCVDERTWSNWSELFVWVVFESVCKPVQPSSTERTRITIYVNVARAILRLRRHETTSTFTLQVYYCLPPLLSGSWCPSTLPHSFTLTLPSLLQSLNFTLSNVQRAYESPTQFYSFSLSFRLLSNTCFSMNACVLHI